MTEEEYQKLNKESAYKLGGKTLRFLKRMGKLDGQKWFHLAWSLEKLMFNWFYFSFDLSQLENKLNPIQYLKSFIQFLSSYVLKNKLEPNLLCFIIIKK